MKTTQPIDSILTQRADIAVAASLAERPSVFLSSETSYLDQWFGGGLPMGSVTEWGCPLGYGGRRLLFRFLARATKVHAWPCLWVNGHEELQVFPPAWESSGVDLNLLRFVDASAPVKDLRPVFLEPVFRIVVLDAPARLSKDDCAFLTQQARLWKQSVIIIRNYLLTPERGNVWARLRLNVQYDQVKQVYDLSSVRGLARPTMRLECLEECA